MQTQAFHESVVAPVILALAIAAPMGMAGAMLLRRWRDALSPLASWAAAPALLAALIIPVGTGITIPWLVLGTRFGLDETGQTFLFFTALLWLAAGLFGFSYLARDENRGRFFAFYLLAMCGNIGLILAMDLAGFYAFFALMSFSSYGLVVHQRDPESLRAGRIYIYLVVLGEIMLFAAFVLMASSVDTLALPVKASSWLVFVLTFFGFGIKAGILPLHVWLPLAHPVAPTPASAVLSGAMIKAGLLGWLRFMPLGEAGHSGWGHALIALGLAAAVYGALVGVTQRNPKTVLAYSSISQMGFMTVGVGTGFLAPEKWNITIIAVLLYALHHALAKGAMFIGVGVASAAGFNARRWVAIGLALPALALAGAPLTSGAIAKAALKPAAAGIWFGCVPFFLSVAAVGTTLLMARFIILVWPKEKEKGHLSVGLVLPWGILVAATALTLFVWPASLDTARSTLNPLKWWVSLWPVILGLLISIGAWAMARRRTVRIEIPAGDLVALTERIGSSLAKLWHATRIATGLVASAGAAINRIALIRSRFLGTTLPTRIEQRLQDWKIAGVLFLLLTVVLLLFVSFSH